MKHALALKFLVLKLICKTCVRNFCCSSQLRFFDFCRIYLSYTFNRFVPPGHRFFCTPEGRINPTQGSDVSHPDKERMNPTQSFKLTAHCRSYIESQRVSLYKILQFKFSWLFCTIRISELFIGCSSLTASSVQHRCQSPTLLLTSVTYLTGHNPPNTQTLAWISQLRSQPVGYLLNFSNAPTCAMMWWWRW